MTYKFKDGFIVVYLSSGRTLSELYSIGVFTEQLPPGNESLKGTLEKCVSAAVPNWFLVLNAQLLPQVNVCKCS